MGTTTNYGLPFPESTDFVTNAPAAFEALADDVDSKFAGFSSGTLASRPTSTGGSPGIEGRTYRATDTGAIYVDTGTSWVEVALDRIPDATLLGQWRTMWMGAGWFHPSVGPNIAGHYVLVESGGPPGISNSNVPTPVLVPIVAADHAISGFTTKLRLLTVVCSNSVASGRTFTLGLYTVFFAGSAGDLDTTLGTSSVTSTHASPAPTAELIGTSSEIPLPGDGVWCLGCQLSGPMPANALVNVRAFVQIRHV